MERRFVKRRLRLVTISIFSASTAFFGLASAAGARIIEIECHPGNRRPALGCNGHSHAEAWIGLFYGEPLSRIA